MKSTALLALVLILPFSSPYAAAPELYVGSAPVMDQTSGEREQAMPQALAQVLGKLSGLGTFEDRPEVELGLGQAARIAVSFYYRNQSVLQPDGSASDQLQLVVNFSRRAVDELARTLQLPVWNPERRPLTVWLVVEDDLGRRIMPIELEYAWAQMAQVAADRGMPIERPEPDAEGIYPVDIQLLWGGYTEELTAGEGPADALVISALREGPEWNVRMNLDYGGQRWSWRERGNYLQLMLASGMHRAIDEIAANASIAASDLGRQSHEITVTGILSSADYARCVAYLEQLSLVEDIRVVAASPGTLRLALELNARPDYLARSLVQGGMLSATAEADVYGLVEEPTAADESREIE